MDRVHHSVANWLVGNPSQHATLEVTLGRDELLFESDVLIAVCGSHLGPSILDYRKSSQDSTSSPRPLPEGRPVWLRAGSVLRFSGSRDGGRAYLAVAGGWDVPLIMESRSTLERAKLGGMQGRKLQKGDRIPIGTLASHQEKWIGTIRERNPSLPYWAPRKFFKPFETARSPQSSQSKDPLAIRFVQGAHWVDLKSESQREFCDQTWEVSNQSDRMGYRLSGNELQRQSESQLASEGQSVGTIQLPSDGKPILLMADSAPTGGYARIAHVITADLPLVAHATPGRLLRLIETSLQEAQELAKKQSREMLFLKQNIERLWTSILSL